MQDKNDPAYPATCDPANPVIFMITCPLKKAALDTPTLMAFDHVSFLQLDQLADSMACQLGRLGVREGDLVAFRHAACVEVAALFFAVWRIGASICPLSLRIPQVESQLQRVQPRLYIDSFPITADVRKTKTFLNEPSCLVFTSGSTGTPKIAVLTLKNLLENARPVVAQLDLREGDAWLLNLPLYHVGGIGILLRSVLAGARVVTDSRDPWITHVSAVPTQLYRATPVYKNLKCLLIGGAPIATFAERLPCYLTYGLTEMGSVVTAGVRSLGFPFPGREMRIVDQEIQVQGSALFDGYWGEKRQVGWFATGDLGKMTENGLIVLGRKDRQFISGGENIQPEEIENALLRLPGVSEAAVVDFADPEFGKRPYAMVQSRRNEFEIREKLMALLPKFKIPVQFVFVDSLPKIGVKNDLNAIKKMILRDL